MIEVKRTAGPSSGGRFGVFVDGELHEGGFFSKGHAERTRDALARELAAAAPATCSHCGGAGHPRAACPWLYGGPNVNAISNPDGV